MVFSFPQGEDIRQLSVKANWLLMWVSTNSSLSARFDQWPMAVSSLSEKPSKNGCHFMSQRSEPNRPTRITKPRRLPWHALAISARWCTTGQRLQNANSNKS